MQKKKKACLQDQPFEMVALNDTEDLGTVLHLFPIEDTEKNTLLLGRPLLTESSRDWPLCLEAP